MPTNQPVATRPLAVQINGTWYTYGWDLTKNICELYSTAGSISTSYTYTPFGQVTASGSITQPIQWSCEVWDAEVGMVYYNWRYYNAWNGSWIARDFFYGEIFANLYLYSNNNPIKYLDAKGLKFIENNNEYKEINVQDSYYGYSDDIKADAITHIVPESPRFLVNKIKTTYIYNSKRKVSVDYYKFIPEIKIYQNGKNRNKTTGNLLYTTVIKHELRHVEISLDNWNNLVRSISVYEGVYCINSAPLVRIIIRNLIYIYYHSSIWENVEFDISDYYVRTANKANLSMVVLDEFQKRKNKASNDVREYEKQLREVMEKFLNSEANN